MTKAYRWCAEPCGECVLHDSVQPADGGVNDAYQRRAPLLQLPLAQQAIHDSYGGVLDHVHLHDHYWALGQWFIAQCLPPVYLPSVLQTDSLDVHSVWSAWIHSRDGGRQASHQKAAAATDISYLKERVQHPVAPSCLHITFARLPRKKDIHLCPSSCWAHATVHAVFLQGLCVS